MPKTKTLPISQIKILPDRQRTELGDLSDLAKSLASRGLINPIVVRDGNILIAGERRLRAAILCGWTEIEVRDFEAMDAIEAEAVELEENVKRKDLTWQEHVSAVARLHRFHTERDEGWSTEDTADVVGYEPSNIVAYMQLANALDTDPKMLEIPKLSEARTYLARKNAIAVENIRNELMADVTEEVATTGYVDHMIASDIPEAEIILPPKTGPILCADFIEWSSTYTGPKFNFIHCDFPYGVNLQKSGQVSSRFDMYEDQADIYWRLIEALVKNFDRFMAESAHMVFWYSMKYYDETKELLNDIRGLTIQEFPLIWYKSDQKGIVPDAMRQPRRVYETALMCSRGDRTIRAVKNNAFAGPTSASRVHPSMKPEEMLKYFFEMFVDEETRMIDPTCGSASSVFAAQQLGAKEVLGIEKNPEYVNQITFDFGV